MGELLLLGLDDLKRIVVHARNARFVTVAALRSFDDGLLIEGLGEFANGRGHGWGMAERLMIRGGDGRVGEEGEDELHGWLVDWRGLLGLDLLEEWKDAVLFCARMEFMSLIFSDLRFLDIFLSACAITAADENPNSLAKFRSKPTQTGGVGAPLLEFEGFAPGTWSGWLSRCLVPQEASLKQHPDKSAL